MEPGAVNVPAVNVPSTQYDVATGLRVVHVSIRGKRSFAQLNLGGVSNVLKFSKGTPFSLKFRETNKNTASSSNTSICFVHKLELAVVVASYRHISRHRNVVLSARLGQHWNEVGRFLCSKDLFEC